MTSATSRSWWAGSVLVLLGLALHLALVRLHERGVLAHDTYAYFYPQWIWARQALANGGRGLLWIPVQNCGQPFLANPQVGFLYPPHWLLLLFDLDTGLVGVIVVNQLIGGLGMLWLGSELRLSRTARIVGAIAFSLGNVTVDMAGWSPMHHGPWVWFPAALAATERMLRAPGPRSVLLVAATIALAVLPGYPILGFFVGMVVGLRILAAVMRMSIPHAATALGCALAAAVLAGGLAAAQLIPSTEMAAQSVRLGVLSEADRAGGLTWEGLADGLGRHLATLPLSIPLILLAAPSLAHPDDEKRRLAVFHFSVILVFLGIAFGVGSPLYAIFERLPVGRSFRLPGRAVWPAGFSLAVMVAITFDAAAARLPWPSITRRWQFVAFPLLASLALAYAMGPGTLPTRDRVALWLIPATAGVAALARPARQRLATATTLAVGIALVGTLIADRLLFPPLTFRKMMTSGDSLYRERALFDTVRSIMPAHSRAFLLPEHPLETEFSLMDKTATVFQIPMVWDYEALVSERFGEVYGHMVTSAHLDILTQLLLIESFVSAKSVNRPLLDLVAARILIQARHRENSLSRIGGVVRVQSFPAADVMINAKAQPRTFFVPRVEVLANPEAILERIGSGADDLQQVAFLEAPPQSGFVGDGGAPLRGNVTFERDEPESIVLQVDAPARGFVFLSDQLYPGWEATVNGQPVPIERANVAFRLVEVPQGSSRVAMRYRPRSVALGFALTIASLLLSALLWRWGAPRSDARAAPPPRSPTPSA